MSKAVRSPAGKERQKIKSKIYAARRRATDEHYRIRQLVYQSQVRARKKNLEHTLTVEEVLELWPPNNKCPVFGIPLEWGNGSFRKNSPSLDRIDNSKGYFKENIQVISFRANELKSNASVEELEILVRYLKSLGD